MHSTEYIRSTRSLSNYLVSAPNRSSTGVQHDGWEMKDEGRGRGGRRRDQRQQRDEEDSQSTSLYGICSKQKRATHFASSLFGRVFGPGQSPSALSHGMYVQSCTSVRSRYLAWRIETPTLFILLLLATCCRLVHTVEDPKFRLICGGVLIFCKYTCIPTDPMDKYLHARCTVHPPCFLLLWVGNLQPQKALLGRMDAPAHAWGKAKYKNKNRETMMEDRNHAEVI